MRHRVVDNISEYLFEYVTHYSRGIPNYGFKWLNLYDAMRSSDRLVQEQVGKLLEELIQNK